MTEKEAVAWFGVTPDAVAALRKQQEKERTAKVVAMPTELAVATSA